MKRRDLHIRKLEVRLYDWRVFLYGNRDKFARSTSRRGYGGLAEQRQLVSNVAGMTIYRLESRDAFIGVFDGRGATLVHECIHAAVAILENAGVQIKAENDEPLAYLVEHLVTELNS